MTLTPTSDLDEPEVPAPRRASEELPDLDAVRAHAIPLDDLDQARLVLCVLSRFLGRGRAASRSHFYAMMVALQIASTISVAHDGEIDPPPHPEIAGLTWPHATSVFKTTGLNAALLEDYWFDTRNRASDSCFPIEWVLAFFPPAIWPAVATAIGWGPERARVRTEEAARAMGRMKTKKDQRRRPAGVPLAHGTIDARITALIGLFDELVKLRAQVKGSRKPALPIDLLEPWTFRPPRPNLGECGVRRSTQDNRLDQHRTTLEETARRRHRSGTTD